MTPPRYTPPRVHAGAFVHPRAALAAHPGCFAPPWGPAHWTVMALLALSLLVLALCGSASAQSSFSGDDGAFTVNLPSDWVRIPALELYLIEHPGPNGPVPPEALATFKKTHYGFQKPAEKWFTLPYCIITLETGKKRGPQELFMDHLLAEKDSQSAASPSDPGYRFLDKEQLPMRRMHYYKEVSYSAAQGKPVVMGNYTFLTNQGFLRVAWFIGEDQRREYEDVLHQAMLGLRLAPSLEYTPEKKP